jgi:macrolide-specific efflux system membrane fusion protein
MTRRWRWIVALLVVVVAGGAAWWLLNPPRAPAHPPTVAVTKGNVEATVLASGELQANKLVSVGAEVTGRIKKLNVALGDDVKAGDLIAEIDSEPQENAVKSAQAALTNATAQLTIQKANAEKAAAALTRAEQLRKQKLVSDADYMTAQADAQSAAAQITATQAQLDKAQIDVDTANLNLSRTRITAPMAGTIVAVLVEEGQTVSAQQSAPTLVKIADLDQMLVKAEISEADVPRVAPGQQVYFTILGEPDNKIDATLRSIEPAPESIADTAASSSSSSSSAVYYNGLFQVANPGHKLRIAMTAEVTIVLSSAVGVLTVPSSALGRKTPDGSTIVAVYHPETGTVEPQKVKIGLNNNIVAEVVAGLNEGDLVVATRASGSGGQTGNGGANNRGGFRGGAGIFLGGPPRGG